MTLLNESHNPLRQAPSGSPTAHSAYTLNKNFIGWSEAQHPRHNEEMTNSTTVNLPSTLASAMPVPVRLGNQSLMNDCDTASLNIQSVPCHPSSPSPNLAMHQPHHPYRSALPHRTPPASGARYFGTSIGEAKSPSQRRYASSPLAGHNSARFAGRIPSQPLLASFMGSPDASMHARSSELARRTSTHQARSPISNAAINRRRYSEQSFGNGSLPLVGSLVGSYEESLLNGRMSTSPSKPLTFDAELGVLGLGNCRSALKCPPHLNLKFPAHFYNLEGAAYMEGKVSPSSPYVGTIDLDNHYMNALVSDNVEEMQIDDVESLWRQRSSRTHTMRQDKASKKKPVFPGYRVPPKGQVQLVIKNPNLTAVKVFLVQYDLTEMPAGKKTFVRQKCHVTPPQSSQSTESLSPSDPKKEPHSPLTSPKSPLSHFTSRPGQRETLRYAVHLQFCAVPPPRQAHNRKAGGHAGFQGDDRLRGSPRVDAADKNAKTQKSEPRYYLHKAIRVVFAARVPDKSEKLTVVTETPHDANGDGIYSTFNGPSEEWKEARKALKERSLYGEASPQSSDMSSITLAGGDVAFADDMVNSDPNGERWAQRMPDESDAAMDVEPSSFDIADAISSIDVRSPPSYGSAILPVSIARSQVRSRTEVLESTEVPAAADEVRRANQDRALLQQWHASLNSSRSTAARPSSPTTSRSRPTSPPLTRFPISPTSNMGAGNSFAAMQRSLSNLSSQDSDDSELTRALRSKGSRISIRSSAIRGLSNTSGSNSPALRNSIAHPSLLQSSNSVTTTPIFGATISGLQSPKLSEASVDDEPVSGIMLPASTMQAPQEAGEWTRVDTSAATATTNVDGRPSLLRRLSSQASMHLDNKPAPLAATTSVRSTHGQHSIASNLPSPPSTINAANRFTWRMQSRARSGSEESQ